MKPLTYLESSKGQDFEQGTLVYHKNFPSRIMMCTNVTQKFVQSVVICSEDPRYIGAIADCCPEVLRIAACKIILKQWD